MNTIEFAIKDGVPYAIDFLNPAPDFERDRITPYYFDVVVDRMARAGHRPRGVAAACRIRGRGGKRSSGSARRAACIGQPARPAAGV